MKAKRKIATLTSEENHAWEFAFCFYLEDGKSDLQADRLAWRDLVLEFARLKKHDGSR
jgi:hypothetical protein